MGKTVLPKTLIDQITKLKDQGLSFNEILDTIQEEGQGYVESKDQLVRCIQAIARNTAEPKPTPLPEEIYKKYQGLILGLKESNPNEIEENSKPIVKELLEHIGFLDIQDANEKSGYPNPPFDFFGWRDGKPYMIEFKGSLEYFNAPGETQKRRLQELREKFHTLHVALLQIGFRRGERGEYRILFNEEMDHLFDGYQIPLDRLEAWIMEQLKK